MAPGLPPEHGHDETPPSPPPARPGLASGSGLIAAALFTALALPLVGCPPEGEDIYSTAPAEADNDDDGYLRSEDCNDNDGTIYPGAEEDPNGDGLGDDIDNDCDGQVDEDTDNADDDYDGYSELQGDCDDNNLSIFPNAPDGCDGVDGDCDGLVDEAAADGMEPNDFRAAAVTLGEGELGDITCDFAAANLNLLPTSFNAPGPDVDWFTFYIEEADQTGCTSGITATLKDIPSGQTVQMALYPSGSNDALESTTFSANPSESTAILQWEVPRNETPDGSYYLEITSPSPSSWCAGGMRLVVQGMAPPTEIPSL